MTVTIVSSPPPSTPAAAVDTGSTKDSATDSTAFASLLLGQLLPAVPQALTDTEAEATPETPDDTPVDATSILVAMIAPTEQGRSVDDTIDVTKTQAPALSALDKTGRSRLDQLLAQSSMDKTAQSSQSEEDVALMAARSDDKPAKFAVTASLASTDKPLPFVASQSTDDSAARLSSLAASHAFSQTSPVPESRDTSLTVKTSFHDQSWGTDFSQKVVWLVSNDKQSAQLTLNPPQMGPIDISITVDKGNATASFASANADVREAIETALPRLREMFANAGIQLGQTNVGAESFQQQAANDSANYGSSRWVSDNAILGADSTGSLSVRAFAAQQGNGMVDIFA